MTESFKVFVRVDYGGRVPLRVSHQSVADVRVKIYAPLLDPRVIGHIPPVPGPLEFERFAENRSIVCGNAVFELDFGNELLLIREKSEVGADFLSLFTCHPHHKLYGLLFLPALRSHNHTDRIAVSRRFSFGFDFVAIRIGGIGILFIHYERGDVPFEISLFCLLGEVRHINRRVRQKRETSGEKVVHGSARHKRGRVRRNIKSAFAVDIRFFPRSEFKIPVERVSRRRKFGKRTRFGSLRNAAPYSYIVSARNVTGRIFDDVVVVMNVIAVNVGNDNFVRSVFVRYVHFIDEAYRFADRINLARSSGERTFSTM